MKISLYSYMIIIYLIDVVERMGETKIKKDNNFWKRKLHFKEPREQVILRSVDTSNK